MFSIHRGTDTDADVDTQRNMHTHAHTHLGIERPHPSPESASWTVPPPFPRLVQEPPFVPGRGNVSHGRWPDSHWGRGGVSHQQSTEPGGGEALWLCQRGSEIEKTVPEPSDSQNHLWNSHPLWLPESPYVSPWPVAPRELTSQSRKARALPIPSSCLPPHSHLPYGTGIVR